MANPSEIPYVQQDVSVDTAGYKRKFVVHLVLIVLLVVNVIVLYVLHFNDSSSSGVKITADAFTSNGDIASKVVSFTSTGAVRAGAGTTAYLDAAPLPADELAFMSLARSGVDNSNTAILSYFLRNKTTSVLTTVTVGKDNSAKIADVAKDNSFAGVQIRGIATLSNTKAVILQSTSMGVVHVLPVNIAADKSVAAVAAQKVQLANGSVSNTLGRISATQFAATTFETYVVNGSWWQNIHVGTVSPADGSISVSAPLRFGVANEYSGSDSCTNSKPQAVPAIPGAFVVTWFNSNPVNRSGLCVVLAVANATGVFQLGEVCNKNYQPAYFLDSTSLSDNLVALTFYDKANNNALTIATVAITSAQKIVFRGDYVIQAVAGAFDFGSFYGWSPKPSVHSISADRLAVLFLNPNNLGRPTTQVFKVTDSFSLEPVTPLMRLSNGDFSLVGASAAPMSGAVTLDIVPVSNSSFIAVYSGTLDKVQHKRVTVVEFLGAPVGVGSGANGVVFGGAAKIDNADFTVGKTYFTTTKGDILAATASDVGAEYYFLSNTTVVSKDSRVGVAVSKNTIYVSTSA
ncbi:hypothetical protein H257_07821 [Aphanomyces astaci]|uniref:Uncharacterized protein n=4 Tax=Aphanomyces astaci TaxID=112090 RepID=W4GIF3_APHAT|nr:hypothetical protein H257_07820 [Aphanomyces astaci]XP_009831775.1 hypothetical protein H257_07821 [Aphanomyces astaci]ETV79055.1 hypothetical protein H257_07820 [Aphanomyces astaci]ETV79056.1 hypothetical protein H257_07821 [Aphanomyces astaci]KAF0710847.1 hypothetical protein AaE_012354 [Aphanomyces astaci]RHY02182.1 hypothetical protein DYB36_008629 [Aphanomyces astaci]RHY19431.1 hypothetical protein DYB25_010493 [Aphanomyces astaci]|eukprot:XP_009831774.1 hypothetical protein H257_07820 [Aphanomyces astaci]